MISIEGTSLLALHCNSYREYPLASFKNNHPVIPPGVFLKNTNKKW